MKRFMIFTAILTLAFMPVAVGAQEEGLFLRADELLGYPLADEEGIPIGFLQDFVVRRDGTIPFLVVQFQMSGYTLTYDRYLVPVEQVDFTEDENAIIISGLDLATMQDLPGLEAEEGVRDLDEGYWGPYYGWWGMTPGPGAGNLEEAEDLGFREFGDPENVQGIMATELMGYEFVNPEGEDVGDVEGLMVNVEQQRIAYLGLSFGGFLGIGDKNIAVPLNRVSLNMEEETLLVEVTEEELEAAEGYNEEEWPSQPESALFSQGG